MNKISTKNKGFTLVELIISVALIGILLIPVSSMVLSTVRTNKSAEIKQKATLVGQQILEKFRAIEVNKDGTSFNFTGMTFNEKKADNIFVINDVDGYQVTTTLNKKNTLDDASVDVPKYDCEYRVGVKNEHPTLIRERDATNAAKLPIEVSSNKFVLKILKSGNDRIVQLNNNDDLKETVITKDASGTVSSNVADKKNLNISLNFSDYKLLDQSKYVSNPIIIEIYNEDDKSINLCLEKSENITVNVNTIIGSTRSYDNRPENIEESKVGDIYDITVEVKQSGEGLFVGHVIKNIK